MSKFANVCKIVAQIEFAAEEVDSKVIGRSSRWFYLDSKLPTATSEAGAGAQWRRKDRRAEAPPVLRVFHQFEDVQPRDQFAFDPRALKSYVQHRLISQLEPSIADKAVLGDEFWSYQKDRRLEYISVPNSSCRMETIIMGIILG